MKKRHSIITKGNTAQFKTAIVKVSDYKTEIRDNGKVLGYLYTDGENFIIIDKKVTSESP